MLTFENVHLQAQLKDAEDMTKNERVDAARALERVQAELVQAQIICICI